MARWCVLVLLLAALRAHAEETTTDAASTEGKTEPPTRMTMPAGATSPPPLVHQEGNTTEAPNGSDKAKGAATATSGHLVVVAMVGAWLTLSAI